MVDYPSITKALLDNWLRNTKRVGSVKRQDIKTLSDGRTKETYLANVFNPGNATGQNIIYYVLDAGKATETAALAGGNPPDCYEWLVENGPLTEDDLPTQDETLPWGQRARNFLKSKVVDGTLDDYQVIHANTKKKFGLVRIVIASTMNERYAVIKEDAQGDIAYTLYAKVGVS